MAQNGSLATPAIQPLAEHPTAQQIVTVVGGAGFLGRYVVKALACRGYRVRIAVRKPNLAMPLQTLGNVNQVVAVQANLRDRDSLAHAVRDSHVVINLCGILREAGKQTFQNVHVEGARRLAEVTPPTTRLIHVSAIGADAQSGSAYARSKAAGEAAVLAVRGDAIIFRPSVIFGPGDDFFNRLAALARLMPVMPVLGADTRIQPVFAGDVAEAIARAVDGAVKGGRIYELGGPAIMTMREIAGKVLRATDRNKRVLALSPGLSSFSAFFVELVDKLTLGLILPKEMVFTRDQVTLLKTDNVVSGEAEREGRTLAGLGIQPTSCDGIIGGYLERFRKAGEFETMRERRNLARRR